MFASLGFVFKSLLLYLLQLTVKIYLMQLTGLNLLKLNVLMFWNGVVSHFTMQFNGFTYIPLIKYFYANEKEYLKIFSY